MLRLNILVGKEANKQEMGLRLFAIATIIVLVSIVGLSVVMAYGQSAFDEPATPESNNTATITTAPSTTESEITTTEEPVIAMTLTLRHDPEIEDMYHVMRYTAQIPGAPPEDAISQTPGQETQESYKLVPSLGDDSWMSIDRTRVSLFGIGNLELKKGTTTETGQLTGFYNVYKIEENPAQNETQYYFGGGGITDFLLMGSDTIGRECGGIAEVYSSPNFERNSEGADAFLNLSCFAEGDKELTR